MSNIRRCGQEKYQSQRPIKEDIKPCVQGEVGPEGPIGPAGPTGPGVDELIIDSCLSSISSTWSSEKIGEEILKAMNSEGGIRPWKAQTAFDANSVVYGDDRLFFSINRFTSGITLDGDINSGALKELGGDKIFQWTQQLCLQQHDLVIDGSVFYIAMKNFTTGNAIIDDILSGGLVKVGGDSHYVWIPNTEFKENNIVLDDHKMYIATKDFTSSVNNIHKDIHTGNLYEIGSGTVKIWEAGQSYEKNRLIYSSAKSTLYIANKSYVSSKDINKDILAGRLEAITSSEGLRAKPVQTKTDIANLNGLEYMLVRKDDDMTEWIFTESTVVPYPINTISANKGNGYWKEVAIKPGLRGTPVVDATALKALVANDFELRMILGDTTAVPVTIDKEYVFKLGATTGDIADDAGTGFWIEQVENTISIEVERLVATLGQTALPVTFEIDSPLVFRNGMLSNQNTYQVNPTKTGLITSGEKSGSKITIVNMDSLSAMKKAVMRVSVPGVFEFDVSENLDSDILVFNNGMLLDPKNYTLDPARPTIVTLGSASNTLSVNTVITVLYKK